MSASGTRPALLLWLGGAVIVLASAGAFIEAPFKTCPDCEGDGTEWVRNPGSERPACERCQGKGRLSLHRKWTTKPKMTYVCAFRLGDYARAVQPVLARENLSLIPGDSSLGIIGYYAATPAEARRARKIIEQDARAKGAVFR